MAEEPFSERLKRLEDRIAAARAGRAEPPPGGTGKFTQGSLAWRMVIELVVGMLLGLAIGFGLDALLGTRPIFLVVFALLGFAAGVRTMLRTAQEVQRGTRRGRPRWADKDGRRGGESRWRRGGRRQRLQHPPDGPVRGPPAVRRRRGALVHHHQRHALDGAHRHRRQRPDARRLPRPGAGAVAGAVGRRVDLRLRPQDDRGHRRQGGAEVLPLHHHAVPLHPLRQPAGADPGSLRLDLAHRGHRAPGGRGLRHRDGDRLLQARRALPEPVLGGERADGGAPHRARGDRGHLLLRPPAQPLRPTCRQHDGRPRGAEGLRGLRRRARARRLRADPRHHRRLRARADGGRASRPTSSPS